MSNIKFEFQAIGTHWQIDVFELVEEKHRDELLLKILARISEFEKVYSRFLDDSLVTKIAMSAGGQMGKVAKSQKRKS